MSYATKRKVNKGVRINIMAFGNFLKTRNIGSHN